MTTCPSCNTSVPSDAAFCPECGQPAERSSSTPVESADGSFDENMMTLGGLATLGEHPTGSGSRRGDAAPALEPGTRFADRYTIAGTLGAGGMGVVYRAHDDVADKDVALKLIRPEHASSEREVDRLVQEGLVARDVRHENVVAVYDVGRAGGQPYLSMEVVEGTSLRSWLREKSAAGRDVPADVAVAIARGIAKGLAAAHARGVVHRDLKPENVILLAEPRGADAPLKVLDFGIARAARGTKAHESGSGTGLGTPHYMAPEQVTNPDQAGPAADVYSLSVMLYEMLVGVLPQGHWQPPSGGRGDVSRGLDELVREGLSNRPASRPQSMETFLERLEKGGSGAGVGEMFETGGRAALDQIQGLGERWRANVKKSLDSKWKIGAAVAVVVVILGLLFSEDSEGGNGPHSDDGGGVHSLSEYSGQWHEASGLVFNVDVSPNGSLAGSGRLPDGSRMGLEGLIADGEISFDVSVNGQLFTTNHGIFSGSRQFSVEMFNPYTGFTDMTSFVIR